MDNEIVAKTISELEWHCLLLVDASSKNQRLPTDYFEMRALLNKFPC